MPSKAQFKVISQNDYARRVRLAKLRPPHARTTAGCLPCKEKKVKCDEARPHCDRCRRNHRKCSYPPSTKLTVSVLSAEPLVPFHAPSTTNGTSSLHLMQHLHTHWDRILQLPQSDELNSLFASNALIRSTILAITACHLRHVSPGVIRHRIAECFQQSLALRDCKAILGNRKKTMALSDVNEFVLSAVLLNILALALPETEGVEPSHSWVSNPNEGTLGWLALQAGIRPLMMDMTEDEEGLKAMLNFLSRIFLGVEKDMWSRVRNLLSPDVIPPRWKEIFALDQPSNEVFRVPVMVLARLRDLEPVRMNALKNFAFLAKMNWAFRDLLSKKDERALWIFGYWLGLMQRFEGLWWCEKRVKRDYEAILAWLKHVRLEDRPGWEGVRWREMMLDIELVPGDLDVQSLVTVT